VLIWGKILSQGKDSVYKLYWTPAAGEGHMWKRYDAPLAQDQFRLPEIFWSDFSKVLGLLAVTGAEKFEAERGRYVADRLPPFIARVRNLLKTSSDQPSWDAEARGATQLILANALSILGEQSGQNQPLEEAVRVYQVTLKERTRERLPLQGRDPEQPGLRPQKTGGAGERHRPAGRGRTGL
jgi:hypothetical protein